MGGNVLYIYLLNVPVVVYFKTAVIITTGYWSTFVSDVIYYVSYFTDIYCSEVLVLYYGQLSLCH